MNDLTKTYKNKKSDRCSLVEIPKWNESRNLEVTIIYVKQSESLCFFTIGYQVIFLSPRKHIITDTLNFFKDVLESLSFFPFGYQVIFLSPRRLRTDTLTFSTAGYQFVFLSPRRLRTDTLIFSTVGFQFIFLSHRKYRTDTLTFFKDVLESFFPFGYLLFFLSPKRHITIHVLSLTQDILQIYLLYMPKMAGPSSNGGRRCARQPEWSKLCNHSNKITFNLKIYSKCTMLVCFSLIRNTQSKPTNISQMLHKIVVHCTVKVSSSSKVTSFLTILLFYCYQVGMTFLKKRYTPPKTKNPNGVAFLLNNILVSVCSKRDIFRRMKLRKHVLYYDYG